MELMSNVELLQDTMRQNNDEQKQRGTVIQLQRPGDPTSHSRITQKICAS